jgi:hypothetical protein
MHCDDITGNVSETDTANKRKKNPEPPPIYIYGVMGYKAMVENLAKAVDEETYFTKALSNYTGRTEYPTVRNLKKINTPYPRRKNNTPCVPNQTGPSLQSRNMRSVSFSFDQRNQE